MVLVQPPKKTSEDAKYPCTYGHCAHGSPFASERWRCSGIRNDGMRCGAFAHHLCSNSFLATFSIEITGVLCLDCADEKSKGSKQAATTAVLTSVPATAPPPPRRQSVSGASSPSNATVLARYRALLAFEAVTTVQQMPEMRKEDRWVAIRRTNLLAFCPSSVQSEDSDAKSESYEAIDRYFFRTFVRPRIYAESAGNLSLRQVDVTLSGATAAPARQD
eukprot:scaffold742_cov263-Pinguiococcus_pyrenoidosus.AAC.2